MKSGTMKHYQVNLMHNYLVNLGMRLNQEVKIMSKHHERFTNRTIFGGITRGGRKVRLVNTHRFLSEVQASF